MNKALLPLTEGDQNFVDAAPALFGPAFSQKSKELVDRVKAMRSHLPGHKEGKQFFRNVPPQQQGGTSTAKSQDAEEIRAAEDSNIPLKGRDPSGTNEHRNTHCLKFLTIDFKSMLMNYLACQGITPLRLVNCPPAGRLVHFQ